MADVKIMAQTREETGKGAMRRIRNGKQIPAILYGEKRDPVCLKLQTIEIERLLNRGGAHSILDLQIDDAKEKNLAMIKEVQHATMTSKILHMDLIRISLDKKVEVNIELEIINTDEVKKRGGIITQMINELTVECFPDNIPETIKLDLANAATGDSFKIHDLIVDESVTIMNDPEEVIVAILAPKAEEAAAAATEGEAAEGDAAGGAKAGDAKAGAKAGDAKGGAKAGDAKGGDAKPGAAKGGAKK
ncbi:MAG: 50S ribosomal protein L25 [bacterium]